MQLEPMAKLKDAGVNFQTWSPEMLDAFRGAWEEVAVEMSAEDEEFARVSEEFPAVPRELQGMGRPRLPEVAILEGPAVCRPRRRPSASISRDCLNAHDKHPFFQAPSTRNGRPAAVTGLLRLAELLAWPCRIFAVFCGILLFVLTGVIVYDVIGRRFFATGSFFLQELEWHLHGAIAVLAFGYAYLKNAHVRIDVFALKLNNRTRLMIEVAAIVCFLVPCMVFIAIYGYEFAERAFVRGEGSQGGIGVPARWIIKSAVPLSAVLTLCGGIAVALRAIVALRRPDLLADPFADTPPAEAGAKPYA